MTTVARDRDDGAIRLGCVTDAMFMETFSYLRSFKWAQRQKVLYIVKQKRLVCQ